jgi:hypothetical protein
MNPSPAYDDGSTPRTTAQPANSGVLHRDSDNRPEFTDRGRLACGSGPSGLTGPARNVTWVEPGRSDRRVPSGPTLNVPSAVLPGRDQFAQRLFAPRRHRDPEVAVDEPALHGGPFVEFPAVVLGAVGQGAKLSLGLLQQLAVLGEPHRWTARHQHTR